jgi:LCP family protein required for cell wall assembly
MARSYRTLRLLLLASFTLVTAMTWACSSSSMTTTTGASSTVSTRSQPANTGKPSSTSPAVSTTSTSGPGTLEPLGAYDLVILGNDTREPTVQGHGSSDIIMLLHVDPGQDFLSILSITRDLYVNIPGHGMNKINAAYAIGRAPLAIETIKGAFGVEATKYIELGFPSFSQIIDSLGGIYIDIDRRYSDTPYWPIDFSPGYQLVDGPNALLFARYRFDKNSDFGRMARQQWILAGIREQAKRWDFAAKAPGLISAALGSVGTNMTPGEILSLIHWAVGLDGSRIKQSLIKGQGKMINQQSMVVVDQETLDKAAADFLTPPEAAAAGASTGLTGKSAENASLAAPSTTTTVSPSTLDAAQWRAIQAHVPFALEAPGVLPDGFAYLYKMPEGDGTYDIKVEGGAKPAVRMVYRYKDTDNYLGITATTWTDAPVAAKGVQVEKDGVIYTIVGAGGKAHHIWWTKDEVLYFISNTIMLTVGREELLKMAESMASVGGS